MTEGCLGPHPAVMRRCAADNSKAEVECKLVPSQAQKFTFVFGDPPPFFDLSATPEDIIDSDQAVLREGYIGKPKGIKQVLWERGLWEDGLDIDRARAKLAECDDFKNKKSMLEELLQSSGKSTIHLQGLAE